jgi:haloalkane dehalogenase
LEILRTPAERFDGLRDFPYEPRFHVWDNVRLSHIDAGDGPPVLMLHGEPTWSYLFRKTIPPLVDAGYRCVAFDLPGFGRSDKPADVDWYSYERHVAATASLLEELDLRDVTLLLHDWGGPIGLRVATGPLADRVSRIVAMDTTVLTGQDLGETWRWFRDLVIGRDDLPAGRLVRVGCHRRPPRELVAAYDAPFPDANYKAGVQAFPRLIPLTPENPTAVAGREIIAALRDDARPVFLLWGEFDPIFPREQFADSLHAVFPGADEPLVVEGTGHFLFEDQGEQIGMLVAEWLDGQRARAKPQ